MFACFPWREQKKKKVFILSEKGGGRGHFIHLLLSSLLYSIPAIATWEDISAQEEWEQKGFPRKDPPLLLSLYSFLWYILDQKVLLLGYDDDDVDVNLERRSEGSTNEHNEMAKSDKLGGKKGKERKKEGEKGNGSLSSPSYRYVVRSHHYYYFSSRTSLVVVAIWPKAANQL